MKDKANGFINVLFLPFKAIGYIFRLFLQPIKFIINQNKLEKVYLKRKDDFLKQRKKQYKLNDELI